MFSVSFWQDLLLGKYCTGKITLSGAAWSAVEELEWSQAVRQAERERWKKALGIVMLCP